VLNDCAGDHLQSHTHTMSARTNSERSRDIEEHRLRVNVASSGRSADMAELMPPTRNLIERAIALADLMGRAFVGSEHVVLAMVEADDDLAAHRILRERGGLSAVEQRLSEMFGRLPE
jgi:ATP-dependent Clp protease ATP-binding subunit ClpA